MKGATTIQERLWELRKDKGLNLEELSQKIGISKSALASYESDDNKEINHGSLIALADFYEVSIKTQGHSKHIQKRTNSCTNIRRA